MLINSKSALNQWLEENHCFHDASVLLEPVPGSSDAAHVSLTLRYQVAGGYAAGDMRTVRMVQVVACGVTLYDLRGDYDSDNMAEGADSFDSERDLGFEIDVPGRLRVAAEHFEVVRTADTEERVPEWLSDRDFTVVVAQGAPPTPQEWIDQFTRLGHVVTWRYYAGDARPPDVVPAGRYEGWFIQKRERLQLHSGGLLFDICRPRENGYVLVISKKDPGCSDLWSAAGNYVSGMAGVVIQCGNAELSPRRFRAHLARTASCPVPGTYQRDERES